MELVCLYLYSMRVFVAIVWRNVDDVVYHFKQQGKKSLHIINSFNVSFTDTDEYRNLLYRFRYTTLLTPVSVSRYRSAVGVRLGSYAVPILMRSAAVGVN